MSDRRLPASIRISFIALVIGTISFLAGFIGPVIFSDSNLGPFLGIFGTGPLGFMGGILIGILSSARADRTSDLRTEIRWLFGLLVLVILYFLRLGHISGSIVLVGIGLQIGIVVVGSMLVVAGGKRPAIRPITRRRRKFLVAAAAVMTVMAVFPPVTAVSAEPESTPLFVFVLDRGLDASRIPLYKIDFAQLLVQWVVVALIATAACVVVREEH